MLLSTVIIPLESWIEKTKTEAHTEREKNDEQRIEIDSVLWFPVRQIDSMGYLQF